MCVSSRCVVLLVFSVSAPAVAVVMMVATMTMVVSLDPGLSVPSDAAHNDGDAGESDDHTYDSACHQHWRHQQVAVLRALRESGGVEVAGTIVSCYRLGCGAPLRAPQCPLQLRLQLRSHSGSGSRSDATALGLGWGVPPLRLGLLCVQGRGAPAGPGRTDPRPRFRGEPRPTVSRALPCPALQQQQPRPGRPRAAARATVTLSGPPRRRRGSRVSARRRHGPGHC